ncbi:MAG: hypothetical protein AAFO78_12360 [Pseudomonadota bacterium]
MRIIWGFLLGAVLCAVGGAGYLYLKADKATLVAPSTDIVAPAPFDDDAFFAALKSTEMRAETVSETAIDTIIAAAPSWLAISYDSVTLDGANNTLLVRGLSITNAGETKIGVKADEARFWDLDGDGVADRMGGARLDDRIPVASRIELSGVSLINGDSFAQLMVSAGAEAVERVAGLVGDNQIHFAAFDDFSDVDASVAVGIKKTVITDLALEPFVLSLMDLNEAPKASREAKIEFLTAPTAQAEGGAPPNGALLSLETDADANPDFLIDIEPVHLAQYIAAWNMAYSFEEMALYDMALSISTGSAYGGASSYSYSVPFSGYRGYDRGDTAVTVTKGTSYTSTSSLPSVLDGEADAPAVSGGATYIQTGETERFSLYDLRLRKVYDHLARGVLPDKSETDLFSLGYWHMENDQHRINGEPVYGTRDFTLDLRHFHNVLPTHIDLDVDDFAINYVTYANFIAGFADLVGAGDVEDPDGQGASNIITANIEKVVKILQDNDVVDPNMDLSFTLDWGPDDGNFAEKSRFDLEDFITLKGSAAVTLLSYDVLADNFAFEMTQEDEAAMASAFEETFAFKGLDYRLTDRGGIAKSFALAVGVAEIFPDQPGTQMLIGADPDDLRVLSATSLRLGAGSMAAAFPPAKAYILALADFVAKGGTLIVKAEPETPVTPALLQSYENVQDPQEIVDLFGFSVTHKGSGTGAP